MSSSSPSPANICPPSATLVTGPVAPNPSCVAMPHSSSNHPPIPSVSSSSSSSNTTCNSSSASSALPPSAIAATSSLGPSTTPQPNYLDDFELQSDSKYKQYVKQVESALKGFEYTSEWADLVNALGKLNKVLQNNTKYPVIPRRAIVGQRLAQCMHPALPSGVHLKALETYDLIFRCIGTDRLIQELHIYSKGLFPLLSHAAINVKPALLEIYQTHFVPLGERLRLALDGFVIAVLPGLEEGSDYYAKTESLLKQICDGVGREYFYTAIWRCILQVPSVRLSAICFVTATFNKKKSLEDQLYIMGTSIDTLVNGICNSLLDPNVLVQRSILDLLIATFPMHNRQILKQDMISIITAAVTVLLRRDISLNRRLFSWFRNDLDTIPTKPSRKGDHYFEKYSKHLVSQAFVLCLTDPSEVIATPSAWSSLGELWPYRLLICLLDRAEIRKSILDNLSTEVFRALYLESKNESNFGNEMQRTTNVLINNLGLGYTWKRLLELFSESCKAKHGGLQSTNDSTKFNEGNLKKALKEQDKEPSKPDLERQSSDLASETNADQESVNENQTEEFVGVILRRKSRKYSSRSTSDVKVVDPASFVARNVTASSTPPTTESIDASAYNVSSVPSSQFKLEEPDTDLFSVVQPVGSGKLHIREACAIIDFIAQATDSLNDKPESEANAHLIIVLNEILLNLILYVKHLDHRELEAMIQLSCKITAKIQLPVNLCKKKDAIVEGSLLREQGSRVTTNGQSYTVESNSSKINASPSNNKVYSHSGNSSTSLSGNSPSLRNSTLEQGQDVLQDIREENEPESLQNDSISPGVITDQSSSGLSPITLGEEADEETDAQDASVSSAPPAPVVATDPKKVPEDTSVDLVKQSWPVAPVEPEESIITVVKRISRLFSLFVRERLVTNVDKANELVCLLHPQRPNVPADTGSTITTAAEKTVNASVASNTDYHLLEQQQQQQQQQPMPQAPYATHQHQHQQQQPHQVMLNAESCRFCFVDKMLSHLVSGESDTNSLSPPTSTNALHNQGGKSKEASVTSRSPLLIEVKLVPAYTSLCQLLIRSSLIPKPQYLNSTDSLERQETADLHHAPDTGPILSNNSNSGKENLLFRPSTAAFSESLGTAAVSLPTWLADLLVLSCFTSSSSIEVTYCSISTYLSLLEIMKMQRADVKSYLTLSSTLLKNERIQSPLLEFILNSSSSSHTSTTNTSNSNNNNNITNNSSSNGTGGSGSSSGQNARGVNNSGSSASVNQRNPINTGKGIASGTGNNEIQSTDKDTGLKGNNECIVDETSITSFGPLLQLHWVQFIASQSTYYSRVANLLWDFLSDDYSELHHETACLIQRIHDATEESPIVESVICSNMASPNKCVSYEARKRFSTLYNITRDYHRKNHRHYLHHPTNSSTVATTSTSTTSATSAFGGSSSSSSSPSSSSFSTVLPFHHREFDRPLFFMLDSLSEKLDTHNAQAINWLNQCLRSGDVARILEPLLVILLHPDTCRVSVQHVNVQPTDTVSVSHQSTVSTLLDEIVDAVSEKSVPVEDEDDEKSTLSCASSEHSASSSSSSSASSGRHAISKLISLNSNFISFNQPISVNQLHSHMILYTQVYDSRRALYALTTLQNIILRNPSKVLLAMSTTCISNRLGIRSNELQTLCARHRKSLIGKGFYTELDTESITVFRSSTFLEVVITTCLYYIRSYYSGLPAYSAHLTEDELLGNQKVRILSCEILRLVFSMIVPEIRGKQTFISWMNDLLMRCQVQKVILHSLVSSVYNFQFKSKNDSSNNNNNVTGCNFSNCDDPTRKLSSSSVDQLIKNSSTSDDCFSDTVIELNEKTPNSVGFQEDMQNSLLQLLEQLMILEHEASANSSNASGNSDREAPTHNRKGSDTRASRIRFQPQMSSLKYCPNVLIPSQPMFLSAVQTALQQTCKASLHANWLELVKASLPYAGRSLTRIVVCVVGQICHNLDALADMVTRYENDSSENESSIYSVPKAEFAMPPNYLISLIKSLSSLCHYVLCDTSTAFGGSFFSNPSASGNSSSINASNSTAGNNSTSNTSSSSIGVISVNPIQTISNILHVFSSDPLMSENSARNSSGSNDSGDPLVTTKRTLLNHLPRILASLRNVWKAVNQGSGQLFKLDQDPSDFSSLLGRDKSRKMSTLSTASGSSFALHSSQHRASISSHSNRSQERSTGHNHTSSNILQGISSGSIYSTNPIVSGYGQGNKKIHHGGCYKGWEVMGTSEEVRLAILDLLSPISLVHGNHFVNAISFVWYDLRESKVNAIASLKVTAPVITSSSNVDSTTAPCASVTSTAGSVTLSGHNKLVASASVSSVPSIVSTATLTSTSTLQQPHNTSVIPRCSQDQMILVDLIASIKVLPMDLVIQNVKQVLKKPLDNNPTRKKRIALEVSLLQFFLAYIRLHATNDKSHQLLECWKSLLSLIKDGLSASSQKPLAMFHLLAILHEFVQAAPLIEDRRDQKELQDIAQKLVEACTTVAGARLAQTRWLRKNLEVRPGPMHESNHDDETDGETSEPSPGLPPSRADTVSTTGSILSSALNSVSSVGSDHHHNSTDDHSSFLAKFSVQALNALAEFVAPVLDVVYVSEEKEKVVPLVSSIIYYVTPYLKNHSKHNAPSFMAGSHLLSSITGYQYSRKAWRKEAFELLLDPAFFQMEAGCLGSWKVIVDNLMTHDKTTFRDFLSRMSITQSGSLKIFSSKDQENEQRGQLAKRLAFIIFCSEKDQYQRYMPEIQEKLIECLRMNSSPFLQSQILLCFRVLLIRMSHHHLTSLWPFIFTEMSQAFQQIEMELHQNPPELKSQLYKLVNSDSSWISNSTGGLSASNARDSTRDPAWLTLYLYACKLLDLALTLPADELPQFQMHKWAFVGEAYGEDPWYPGSRALSSINTPVMTPSDPNIRISDSAVIGERSSYPQGSPVLPGATPFPLKSPSPSPTPSRNSFTGSTLSVVTTSTITSNVTHSSMSGIRNTMTSSPVISTYPNPPFESHVVRIEKTLRIKNPNPEILPYVESRPLLALTSIKSIYDLHPFFHTLVRATSHAGKASPGSYYADVEVNSYTGTLDSTSTVTSSLRPRFVSCKSIYAEEEADATVYLDRILERDFLEE